MRKLIHWVRSLTLFALQSIAAQAAWEATSSLSFNSFPYGNISIYGLTAANNDVYMFVGCAGTGGTGSNTSYGCGDSDSVIFKWNKTTGWSPALTNSLVSGAVTAVELYGGYIYVAGYFDSVGEGANMVTAHGVARYRLTTGLWSAVGTATSGVTKNGQPASIRALKYDSWAGRLYAGGTFDAIGGTSAGLIASWGSTGWAAVPGANLKLPPSFSTYQGIRDISIYNQYYYPYYPNTTTLTTRSQITVAGNFEVFNASNTRISRDLISIDVIQSYGTQIYTYGQGLRGGDPDCNFTDYMDNALYPHATLTLGGSYTYVIGRFTGYNTTCVIDQPGQYSFGNGWDVRLNIPFLAGAPTLTQWNHSGIEVYTDARVTQRNNIGYVIGLTAGFQTASLISISAGGTISILDNNPPVIQGHVAANADGVYFADGSVQARWIP